MPYRPREVFCEDCKKLYLKKHPKSVRCPECQKEYNRVRAREYYRETARVEVQKDPHICARAKSCEYGGTLPGCPCCDYMLETGHKRPCPVKGCTEYKRKRGGSKADGEGRLERCKQSEHLRQ